MLMSDFNINPSTILAINPFVNADPNIRPDNSRETAIYIHSSLSTAFLLFTTLVKATRNRSGACDNLDTLVCVKPAVLAF